MPFMTPPMPCSRTPKWSWRPSGCSADWHRLAVELGAGVAGEVGAAGDQPGHDVGDGVEARLDGVAGGDLLAGSKVGSFPASPRGPGPRGRRRARPGRRSTPPGAPPTPRGLRRGDARAGRTRPRRRAPRTLVGRQAEDLLGEPDLVLAERVAVGLRRVGELGRRPADVAAQHDQRRPVLDRHGPAQRRLEGVGVVGDLADPVDVPAVGLEAAAASSLNASSVGPSMVMWLSS